MFPWCHDMETLSTLLALCEGNPPLIPLRKGQWCEHLMFLWYWLEPAVGKTVEGLVIWDDIPLMRRHCNDIPGDDLDKSGSRASTGIDLTHVYWIVNTLRPRQNGHHFADDIFKRIFSNENVEISIKISLKFVPKGRINNIPALVQVMARRRPGDKPLTEPMVVRLLTHICVTRPQWVKQQGLQPCICDTMSMGWWKKDVTPVR